MTDIFAKAVECPITPPVGVEMVEPRWVPSTGIHDDLYARTLALSDGTLSLAIVCLDLPGLDLKLVDMIRQAVWEGCRLPAGQLMLNTTHTHSAPNTIPWGHLAQTRRNRAWEQEMVGKVAEAVTQAIQGMRPAALNAGWGEVLIGFNRRLSNPNGTEMVANAQGPNASEVSVLRVDSLEPKQPIAVLFSHAAHAVVVHVTSTQVSADYPGFACQEVTRRLGRGAIALFAQGCCGDINVDPLMGGFEEARRVGEKLGAAAAQAALQAAPLPVGAIKAIAREVALPYQIPDPGTAQALVQRAREGLAYLKSKNANPSTLNDQQELVTWAEKMVRLAQQPESGLPFRAQGFALGKDLVLLGLSHEVFIGYQLALQKASPFPHTMIFGYTNGCDDYIPTAEALFLGGYEVQGAPKYYGQPPLKPECEALVKTVAVSVLQDLWNS